jgi:lysophospholipase L1-like esterase
MDRPPALLSKISFSISFTVVLLILIEIVSSISARIADSRRGGLENAQAAASLSVYKSQPWAATYWREEVAAFKTLYEPYTLWKRGPYQGETVTIDEDGIRLTTHSQCAAQNYTIWMFGGSTMWGAGSPNWLTIPSLLAEQYEKSGRPVCVRNYGTTAWVNTQEVVKFMLEVKRASRKPDLVLFYDGANDSYSVYQSGMIDVPVNNDLLRKKLEEGEPVQWGWTRPKSDTQSWIVQYFRQSKTAQAISRLGARLRTSRSGSQPAFTRQLSGDQIRSQMDLAYLKNLDLVDALARQYGFKTAFFWQPVMLVGHKHLSAEEEAVQRKMVAANGGIQPAFQGMYDLAQKGDRPNFFDIADVLDNREDTIYIDFAHLSPEGNRIVAARMYDVLHDHGM